MSWIERPYFALFGLVLVCLSTVSGMAQTAESDSIVRSPVSAEDLLDWIERYRSISPENAELLRQSLDRQADPAARLELALLELHASLSPSVADRGLERLNVSITAIDSPESADWITPTAVRWLVQWQQQVQAMQALEQQAEDDAARLERERRAHLATLEKLDALRSIERELEQRSTEDETSQEESESFEDETEETPP